MMDNRSKPEAETLEERRRRVRMSLGERGYQFKPYTSKNIGKNLVKTGKCYNRPYVKPEGTGT